ncbi:MAG: hypothetical protein LBV27_06010, partial [Oscillospiraceae bacterium]|nr:hypothetical protein [Oscillospiraceae bacterium]
MLRYFLQTLWRFVLLYLVFAHIASTVPWIFQKRVGAQARERLSDTDFYGGDAGVDRVALVEEPGESFAIRVQLLRHAANTLDIAYHAIQEGVTTEAFLGEILIAADRGVRVRILIDAKTGV